jgi:hypothetical protein
MSTKQTRKSVSISGEAYSALKSRCEADGTSMSGVCEKMIRQFLAMADWSVPGKVVSVKGVGSAKIVKDRDEEARPIENVGGVFTF